MPTVIAAGAAASLAIALTLVHDSYDLTSFRIVDETLRTSPSLLYETNRWPQPGGALPLMLASGALERLTDVDFSVWVKLPSIAAQAAIAWLVQAFLGLRGAATVTRLAAAALVALGPVFIATCGYAGQIDALAILPAVIAAYTWERMEPGARRELAAALLLGAGATIKATPLLMVLAFAPLLDSWRARARFAAVAAALPALTLVPWIVSAPDSLDILSYSGLPGAGSLSLAVQPELARAFLNEAADVRYSSLTIALQESHKPFLLVGLAALGLFLLRRRLPVERAAVLVWLTVYALLPNFFFHYLVWGLPFFLMAGHIRAVAAAQVALAVPLVLFEGRPWDSGAVPWVYVVLVLGTWAAGIAALAARVRASS